MRAFVQSSSPGAADSETGRVERDLRARMRGAVGERCGRWTIGQDLPQLACDALRLGWDSASHSLTYLG